MSVDKVRSLDECKKDIQIQIEVCGIGNSFAKDVLKNVYEYIKILDELTGTTAKNVIKIIREYLHLARLHLARVPVGTKKESIAIQCADISLSLLEIKE